MTKTTHALNCDKVARTQAGIPKRIKRRYAGAQEWSRLRRCKFIGN